GSALHPRKVPGACQGGFRVPDPPHSGWELVTHPARAGGSHPAQFRLRRDVPERRPVADGEHALEYLARPRRIAVVEVPVPDTVPLSRELERVAFIREERVRWD